MLTPGEILNNRYQIIKQIGSGGMGVVFLAFDQKTESQLVIKALSGAFSERRANNFVREFEILSSLKHPAIVEAYEIGFLPDGNPFFSMQMVAGESLSQLLKPDLTLLISILKQLAAALVYIHSHSIIYCDLKPSNVICNSEQIKLLDFGIAQQITNQLVENPEPAQQAMTGTSLYMSPEQIRGEALDARSDIYSFGVLAFELCTGKVPYDKNKLFEITASHLIGRIPGVREFNKEIPKALETVIMLCLQKNKAERYQSVAEVLERLERAQQRGWIGRVFGF